MLIHGGAVPRKAGLGWVEGDKFKLTALKSGLLSEGVLHQAVPIEE